MKNFIKFFSISLIFAAINFLNSCQKEETEAKKTPTVGTAAISNVSTSSASSGGNISDDGGAAITKRGVVWGTTNAPTISLSTKTTDGSGTGTFASNLTGLLAGTKYYVRAFATNSAGTGYGDELTFTTLTSVPILTSNSITNITSTSAAGGGNISSDGGASITARGVIWSTDTAPTISLSTKTTDGSASGNFTSNLTGLASATKYYVRAYATNSVGTSYGNEITFTTSANLSTLTTNPITNITSTSASGGGNVSSDGGTVITARGIVWGTNPAPTISLSTKTTAGSGTGSFTSNLTGLLAATKYYVRAYATNSLGTSYGEELAFTTSANLPALTSKPVINITSTSASGGGIISSDGEASITARGVVWSPNPVPTIALATKTTDGLGTGSFTSNLSGLSGATKYYVRAYATNSVGTSYGDEVTFTTSVPGVHDSNKVLVPVGGNSWVDNGALIATEGLTNWTNSSSVCKTYIRLSQPGALKVSLKINAGNGTNTIKVTVLNKSVELTITGNIENEVFVGEWDVPSEGYISIDVQGISKASISFGLLTNVVVSGSAVTNTMAYVPDNTDNRFYWQRRGPALSLFHDVTGTNNIEWYYSEIKVPTNSDVIGSYYMANGFAEGYFGFQVVSSTERIVLFSVWSPFVTDDPTMIPLEDQVILVRKGVNVVTGSFGNEGSGGKSYLKYNWIANNTYKFLVQGKPIDSNNTQYTAWFFAPEENKWFVIASWKRPKTSTYLKSLYSFIENFNTETGNIARMALYGNQWVRENGGTTWKELKRATLTGSEAVFRKDYAGGIEGSNYYLKISGHFNQFTELNTTFTRQSLNVPPSIDLSTLP